MMQLFYWLLKLCCFDFTSLNKDLNLDKSNLILDIYLFAYKDICNTKQK